MNQLDITKKSPAFKSDSLDGSSKSYCFNYFFNFCKNSDTEGIESKHNSKKSSVDDRILVTQHYSTHVNPSSTLIKENTQNNSVSGAVSLAQKYQFKMTPDLKLYNNMQLLLTFKTNLFLLRSSKRGIIAKFNVKLLKIDRSYSEKLSFQKEREMKKVKAHRNTAKNASSKNSVEDLEPSKTNSKRNERILQEIVHYFAKRMFPLVPLILDLSNNEGVTGIAWAMEGSNVLIVEEDPIKLNNIKANVILSGERNNIDIIHGRLQEMKQLRANLVFYQPDCPAWVEVNGEIMFLDNFSLEKDLPKGIIAKCLSISENLVIHLPKCCDLNELAEVFADCFEQRNIKPLNSTLHVEMIYVNNLMSCYLVCYGPIFSISSDEEIKFLISCLIPDQQIDSSYEYRHILKNIISKIGIYRSCEVLAYQLKQIESYKDEEMPFEFNKWAYALGFIKEAQMNENNERLNNLKYSCSSISQSDTEKQSNTKYQNSFSFNPFKTLKNMPKSKRSKLEQDSAVLIHDNRSETGSKNTKNENEEGVERMEPIIYSPSSYSGVLMNSHDSSLQLKDSIKDDENYFHCGNMIMIEKEHEEWRD